MKQLTHANPSLQQPASEPRKIARSPLVAKIAGCAVAAGLFFSGCMAPRYNVFEPRPARTGEAVPLNEDIYRAFEHGLRTSHNRVEISGRGGAFGSWSYRLRSRDGNVLNYEFKRNTLPPNRPATMVAIGPGSESFNIRIPEPTGIAGSDILVVTEINDATNIATLRYQNPQGAWEIIDIEFPRRLVGANPKFDVMLSRDGNKMLIVASPTPLEDGMPSAIVAAVFNLQDGRIIPSDYLPPAK
ncbi:hypothetical protein H0O01_01985 [Candidatus Micrarchaeota archaeon]|nr:hypothetical protein [Candidatus Micrarchaeota archaeon]